MTLPELAIAAVSGGAAVAVTRGLEGWIARARARRAADAPRVAWSAPYRAPAAVVAPSVHPRAHELQRYRRWQGCPACRAWLLTDHQFQDHDDHGPHLMRRCMTCRFVVRMRCANGGGA